MCNLSCETFSSWEIENLTRKYFCSNKKKYLPEFYYRKVIHFNKKKTDYDWISKFVEEFLIWLKLIGGNWMEIPPKLRFIIVFLQIMNYTNIRYLPIRRQRRYNTAWSKFRGTNHPIIAKSIFRSSKSNNMAIIGWVCRSFF